MGEQIHFKISPWQEKAIADSLEVRGEEETVDVKH